MKSRYSPTVKRKSYAAQEVTKRSRRGHEEVTMKYQEVQHDQEYQSVDKLTHINNKNKSME